MTPCAHSLPRNAVSLARATRGQSPVSPLALRGEEAEPHPLCGPSLPALPQRRDPAALRSRPTPGMTPGGTDAGTAHRMPRSRTVDVTAVGHLQVSLGLFKVLCGPGAIILEPAQRSPCRMRQQVRSLGRQMRCPGAFLCWMLSQFSQRLSLLILLALCSSSELRTAELS